MILIGSSDLVIKYYYFYGITISFWQNTLQRMSVIRIILRTNAPKNDDNDFIYLLLKNLSPRPVQEFDLTEEIEDLSIPNNVTGDSLQIGDFDENIVYRNNVTLDEARLILSNKPKKVIKKFKGPYVKKAFRFPKNNFRRIFFLVNK